MLRLNEQRKRFQKWSDYMNKYDNSEQIMDNHRTGVYPYHINHDLRQSDYFYNKNYTEFHEHDFQSILLRVSDEPKAFYLTEDDKKYYSTQELEVIEKISK